MGIGSHSRIENSYESRRRALRNAVDSQMQKNKKAQERKERFLKKNGLKKSDRVGICSQCNRAMSKKMADTQIENKREMAPICMACIMGVPRKPLKTKVGLSLGKSSSYHDMMHQKKEEDREKRWDNWNEKKKEGIEYCRSCYDRRGIFIKKTLYAGGRYHCGKCGFIKSSI
jgi:hypothetical protein